MDYPASQMTVGVRMAFYGYLSRKHDDRTPWPRFSGGGGWSNQGEHSCQNYVQRMHFCLTKRRDNERIILATATRQIKGAYIDIALWTPVQGSEGVSSQAFTAKASTCTKLRAIAIHQGEIQKQLIQMSSIRRDPKPAAL